MGSRLYALPVFAAVTLHVLSRNHLQEALWACHIASFLLAFGLALQWNALTRAAFIFYLGVGIPGWLLDAAVDGTTWTSALTHLTSLTSGWLACRHMDMSKIVIAQCMTAMFVLLVVTPFITDPALNVNVTTRPWLPLPFLEHVNLGFNLLTTWTGLMLGYWTYTRFGLATTRTAA